MSKTSKTAKCPLPVRIRKRLEVTIDPENHEYLKNAGVNVSRLLDKAISELRRITPHSLVLISQKKEESWARGDSNARTPPCEGDVITPSVSDLAGGEEPDEISRTAREGIKESLTEFYLKHKDGFIASMEREKLSRTTINGYSNAIENLKPIYAPIEVSTYAETYGEELSEKVGKAVSKFATYMRLRHGLTTLLGFDPSTWGEQFNAAEALKQLDKEDDPSRVKDMTEEEITRGYQYISEELQPFYAFLVYTGMRAGQAYDVLKTWKDDRVETLTANVDGKAVKFHRYPTSEISRGKKFSFYAYFPPQVYNKIRGYKPPYTLDTITRMIREIPTDPERPLNVSNIRKFAVNMLRKGKAVEADVAEYIQGRKPKGVGAARYVALKNLANEQYPIALHRNMPDILSAPKLTPPPKEEEKPKPAPKKKAAKKKPDTSKQYPPLKTTGKDLQKIWLDHEASFGAWCLQKGKGIIKKPDQEPYIEYTVKINGFFRKVDRPVKTPADTARAGKKEITALRMFLFDYLPEKGISKPVGYTADEWREYVNYSGKS